MSGVTPHNREHDISENDLFGSIPRALDINPFEGINLDDICVITPDDPVHDDDWDFIEINPIEGIDIAEMSVIRPDGSWSKTAEDFEVVEIKPDYSRDCVMVFVGRLVSAIPVQKRSR